MTQSHNSDFEKFDYIFLSDPPPPSSQSKSPSDHEQDHEQDERGGDRSGY